MAAAYHIGDTLRIQTTTPFATAAGTATDPTTVTLTLREPDGTETSWTYAAAELTKAAAGDFYRDVTVDQAGTHYWRFVGTGTVASADEGFFVVQSSPIV